MKSTEIDENKFFKGLKEIFEEERKKRKEEITEINMKIANLQGQINTIIELQR